MSDSDSLIPFPIMGAALTSENTLVIDLSNQNQVLSQLDFVDVRQLAGYVDKLLCHHDKNFAIGGYLENRLIYRRSGIFSAQADNFRNIHLGIDIWARPGMAVYCPMEGVIHSFQDNIGFGNYGPTIILEHQLQGKRLYSLYGHLSRSDLSGLKSGSNLKSGAKIGHLGQVEENGNWPPHLHFQLIWDLENNWGDYPGVCREEDLSFYGANCPNPNLVIKCPLL